jgi:hypothetical protein
VLPICVAKMDGELKKKLAADGSGLTGHVCWMFSYDAKCEGGLAVRTY